MPPKFENGHPGNHGQGHAYGHQQQQGGPQPIYVQPAPNNNAQYVQPGTVQYVQQPQYAPSQIGWTPPPKVNPNGPAPVVYVAYDPKSVKTFPRQWKIGVISAPCHEPCMCLKGCFCGPCFAYAQREEIMGHPRAIYRCCLNSPGPWYCCGCELPRCCLAWEVCCCYPWSVLANRQWIQMNYQITNSGCDNCLMCFACCAGIICRLAMNNPQVGDQLACIIRCSVLGCMLTQQQHEMDHLYDGFAPPPQQQMMQ